MKVAIQPTPQPSERLCRWAVRKASGFPAAEPQETLNGSSLGRGKAQPFRTAGRHSRTAGFSLLEMLVSVAIIGVIMSAVFGFMYQVQKRFQGTVVSAESNQSARGGLEVLTQEIGQAGFNPNWYNPSTANLNYRTFQTLPVYGMVDNQCVPLYDSTGGNLNSSNLNINAGDWLSVDTGGANELIQTLATSYTPDPTGGCATTYTRPCPCPLPSTATCLSYPQPCVNCSAFTPTGCIKAVFQVDHISTTATPPGTTPNPWPALSYKFPYPTGVLTGTVNGQGPDPALNPQVNTPVGTPTTSNDNTLALYGDLLQKGSIHYVLYSLSPTTNPPTVLTLNNAACNGDFTLYNLYRSATPVRFPASTSLDTNAQASALVQNVLYYMPPVVAGTATPPGFGPTCQPLFGYPNTFLVGVFPNQLTVIGTLAVTISVAVNPQRLESGIIEWYTMASEIRPLNLAAAVAVNQIGGFKFLPQAPLDLPMIYPTAPTYWPL